MVRGEAQASSCDLDSPANWIYKAQGNANIVYDYQGYLARLKGKVLKVRKKSGITRRADAVLEEAVWAPVLGTESSTPLERECRYTEQCLVPLIGKEYIPDVEYVEPSPAFLADLDGYFASSCFSQAGPTLAALLPDVTLLPSSLLAPSPCFSASITQSRHEDAANTGDAPCKAALPDSGMHSELGQQAQNLRPGQVLCVEIKPKCGFLARCVTVSPENRIKHSRSRYQLHQLLKVSEGKAAQPSTYDPLDLFSQDSERMLRALRALLGHPQNNLKFFLDGRPVGVAEGLQMWSAGNGAHAIKGCAEDGFKGTSESSDPCSRTACKAGLDESCGGKKPFFHKMHAAASHPSQPDGDKQVQSSRHCQGYMFKKEEELLFLLLKILEREDILTRILAAQQQCLYDIEGIFAIYCKLKQSAAAEAVGAGKSCGQAVGRVSSEAADIQTLHTELDGTDGVQSSARVSHSEALQQLLDLPPDEAYRVLRRYVVSATAKDCAIMIAIQQLRGSGCSSEGTPIHAPGLKMVQHPRSGAWYQYRVAVVDLDMKALAKIPKHYHLDQQIMHAARTHGEHNEDRHLSR